MCYWKHGHTYQYVPQCHVSILLILDVLLEAETFQLENRLLIYGFNPSYTGCATGRLFFMNSWSSYTSSFNPSYTGCATGRLFFMNSWSSYTSSFNPSYTGCATGSIRR